MSRMTTSARHFFDIFSPPAAIVNADLVLSFLADRRTTRHRGTQLASSLA